MDTADSMATEEPHVHCHDDGADDDDVSECAACDERERFALMDSPPDSVVTGLILHVCYTGWPHSLECCLLFQGLESP